MTYPRRMTVDPEEPGFYHCISRCVRRAWLCGDDPHTGQNFDHRRAWIEVRLVELSDVFAVGIHAWAVMSNHTHLVLRVDPRLPWQWSDEEVAHRWTRLSCTFEDKLRDATDSAQEQALLADPERLEEVRARLGSLSWFMRYLNESIARRANAEDKCTGRFWEGRFRCQALIDDHAVLAAMTYVDLNPMRAGLVDEPVQGDFTTIQRRMRNVAAGRSTAEEPLRALTGVKAEDGPAVTQGEYIALVAWSSQLPKNQRKARNPKADTSKVPLSIPAALEAIRGSPRWWQRCAGCIETAFGSAVGLPARLRARAAALGRKRAIGTRIPQ